MSEPTPETTPAPWPLEIVAPTKHASRFQVFKQMDVWKGIGLLCLFHAILYGFVLLQRDLNWEIVALLFISITQLIYAVPLYLFLRWRDKKIMAQGVLIGMTLTFLVNATCAGIVFSFKIF